MPDTFTLDEAVDAPPQSFGLDEAAPTLTYQPTAYELAQVNGDPSKQSFEDYLAEHPRKSDLTAARLLPLADTPEKQGQLARFLLDNNTPAGEVDGAVGQLYHAVTQGPIPQGEHLLQASPKSTAGKVALGTEQAGEDLGNFFLSPLGIATLGIGALPKGVQKVAALAFSAQMASQLPGEAATLVAELKKPNPDWTVVSHMVTGTVANAALAGFGAKYGLESKSTTLAKSLAKELDRTVPVTAELPVAPKTFSLDEAAPADVVAVESNPAVQTPGPADVAADVSPLQSSPTEAASQSGLTPAAAVPLVPVDVTANAVNTMKGSVRTERPPDVLDTIEEHFPNGVKFDAADHADQLQQAADLKGGTAKTLMSHTDGEPADKVLDGLHLEGLHQGIENVDELASAMVQADQARLGRSDRVSGEARQLAEEQARTKLFDAANLPTRKGVESLPVESLFIGDTFKLNGEPMTVTDFPVDAETGKPFGVELQGAYGKQHVNVGEQIHIDEGSLKDGNALPQTPGRVAASGTSAPRPKPGAWDIGRYEDAKSTHDRPTATPVEKAQATRVIQRLERMYPQLTKQPELFSRGRVAAAGGAAPRPSRSMAVPAAVVHTPAPAVGPLRTWAKNVANGFKSIFAPHTLDDGAATVANILRDVNGEKANNLARADEAMHSWRREFDHTPVAKSYRYDPSQPLPHNYAIIDSMEHGGIGLPPRYQALKVIFDQAFADRIKVIQQFAPNALQHLIQNYFPHLWEDPKRAEGVMQQVATKLFAGRKEFLKQRSLPMFTDGLARGLKPISDNPVDLLLAKMHSMDKFIAALKAQAEFKAIGKMKFKYALEAMPDGWVAIKDPAFIVHAPPVVTIKEAFDAQMRTKTLEFLQKLGVKESRLASLGGKRWGLAYESPEQIKTRFGGPMSVYWHELGHILDFRYNLQDTFLKQNKNFDAELRALADRRLPANYAKTRAVYNKATGKSVNRPTAMTSYVRRGEEKMAVMAESYVHAPEVFKKVAPTVYAQFDKFITDHPELHDIRDIKPSLRLESAEMEQKLPGVLELGQWIMPEGPAQVIHNYLSPGLASRPGIGPVYRSLRAAGNYLNQAQLGLSGFHVGFTSLDAAFSTFSTGLVQLSRGNLRGAVTLARSPLAPVLNYYTGKAIQRAMLDPKATTIKVLGFDVPFNPAAHNYAALAVKAGLRATVDPMWQTHMTRNLVRAYHEGGLALLKLPFQAPFALTEQLMRPIAEYLVPRQKLGVFAMIAKAELEKAGPGADVHAVRAAVARAADYTEDRMGQMTYDNLFYNKIATDLALISFRAYGWQLGKYRHLFGAVSDTAAAVKGMATGKVPELSHRQAYFIALTLGVAGIGGILHKLFTGQNPQTPLDYFHPGTGQLDAGGNPKRLSLPTYMKDLEADYAGITKGYAQSGVVGIGTGLAGSTYHRLNPGVSIVVDMLNNKDFYGTQIAEPTDPHLKQLWDQTKFALKAMTPFSISGAMKLSEGEASTRDKVLPFIGVVPASKILTMTPTESYYSEQFRNLMPAGAKTPLQGEQAKLRAKLVTDLKTAQAAGKPMTDLPARLLAAGVSSEQALTRLGQKAELLPIQYQAHYLPLLPALRGFDLASPAEKASLAPILLTRVQTAYESDRLDAATTSAYVKLLVPFIAPVK